MNHASKDGPVEVVGYEPPFVALIPRGGDTSRPWLARVRARAELRALFGEHAQEESVVLFSRSGPHLSLDGRTLIRARGRGEAYSRVRQVEGLDATTGCELPRLHEPGDGGNHAALDRFWERVVARRTCSFDGCGVWLDPGLVMCSQHWEVAEDERQERARKERESVDTANEREAALRAERVIYVPEFPEATMATRKAISETVVEGPPCVECGSRMMRGVINLTGFFGTRQEMVRCDGCGREYGWGRTPPDLPERRVQTPVTKTGDVELPSVIRRRESSRVSRERAKLRKARLSALDTAMEICDAGGDRGWVPPDPNDESVCTGCGAPLKGPRHSVEGPRCSVNIYEARISGGDWVGPTVLGVDLLSDWMHVASDVWPERHQREVPIEVRRSTRYGTEMNYTEVLESCVPKETAARTILEGLRVDPSAGDEFRRVLHARLVEARICQ